MWDNLKHKNETEIKDVKAELSRKGEIISALGANVGSLLKDDVGVIKSDIKRIVAENKSKMSSQQTPLIIKD